MSLRYGDGHRRVKPDIRLIQREIESGNYSSYNRSHHHGYKDGGRKLVRRYRNWETDNAMKEHDDAVNKFLNAME